ncbi:MAG: hypothetical protein NT062_16760 [Proteobacteria bacterium]|nr:hypothetical protein [Pseudomonadota bacterium]
MYVLITWGSKRGGTEGIARIIGETLREAGLRVELRPASTVRGLDAFDAVIVGGALYANRWHRDARRFVARHVAALRHLPVWLFSSGPLDTSADRGELPTPSQVAVLQERIGAHAHVTFGGRLAPDAEGLAAHAMARTSSGDWRNPERIRAWAAELATTLAVARPGVAVDPPARAGRRLVAHGLVAAASSGGLFAVLLALAATPVARGLHAIATLAVFAVVARHYFVARGARDPLPTAAAFGALFAAGELAIVGGVQGSLAIAGSVTGFWVPLLIAFAITWVVGLVASTMPWPTRVAGADVARGHAIRTRSSAAR